MLKFTIKLPPVTKKNSQQIRFNPKTGKRFVTSSEQYKRYEKAAMLCIPTDVAAYITEPVEVKALFYMPTRRRVDLTNLLEALDDTLVCAGLLADDNCRIIVSHDGSRVLYDKAHPRTEVTISRCKGAETTWN